MLPNSSLTVEYEYLQTDYHRYRQDSDGLWSHKNGGRPVSRLDASDNLIYDPQICDRNYESSKSENYSLFIGYFAVTPWNGYFEGGVENNGDVKT